MKRAALVILLLLLGASVYWHWRGNSSPNQPPKPISSGAAGELAGSSTPATARATKAEEVPPPVSASSTAAPRVASAPGSNAGFAAPTQAPPLPAELASLPADTILENMRTTVRLYGSTFGGNPVGTNPEITGALQGENPKHINFLKADGNRVNGNGELVDPWGTPYFFHQLSGTEMEIRSAGPDRRMWTDDDLVTR